VKIGIDALFLRLGKVGGTESYLINLLKGINKINKKHQYYIFVSYNVKDKFDSFPKRFKIIVCGFNNNNRWRRIIYQNIVLPKVIKKMNLDIMFFPTYVRCLGGLSDIKVISNIHDLQYLHYPRNFGLLKRMIFNIFYPASIQKSDKLVSISNFVKDDIVCKFGDRYKDKINTIYNPIDFEEIHKVNKPELLKKFDIDADKYILSVASLLPHKNIITLIKAFDWLLKIKRVRLKLILVGLIGKSTRLIMKTIEKYKIEDKVVILGYVTSDVLSTLYKNAKLFISPSLFEGFGMPVIEAMFSNVPVITTKEASLPEVTMNKAFYYYLPRDYKRLALKIREVLECYPPDSYLSKLSDEVYKKYNKERIAADYINLFESLI
jgi:glycosyltransferase involved in cell wall biosynthesis